MISSNFLKIKKFYALIIFFLYFLILFRTYAGNIHSVYLYVWSYSLGEFQFPNDINILNTNQTKISIIYWIFNLLNLNMDNDFVGFITYILFTSLSFFYLGKILKEFFKISDFLKIIIVLFSIIFIGNFLVLSNISSWIVGIPTSPTLFSHSLIFPFIYFLLKKKQLHLFIISILMMLIAIKASWFAVGTGIIFSLTSLKKKEFYWIIGPVLVLFYYIGLSDINLDDESRKILFQNVLSRDAEEVAFHLQGLKRNLILILSFIAYFFLLKKINNQYLKKYGFIVLALSISSFIFGYFYAKFGIDFWPQPNLLALSFTRALGIYQLFFWLLFSNYILKSNLSETLKTILFASIFYFNIDMWENKLILSEMHGLMMSILLLGFYFAYMFIKRLGIENKFFKKNYFNKNKENIFSIYLFFLIISFGLVYSLNIKIDKKFNYHSFKNYSKWTVPKTIDKEKLDNLFVLRKCNDFLLLDLENTDWSPALAGKSQFMANVAFNHFSLKILQARNIRQPVIQNLKEKFFSGKEITNEMIKELYKYNVIVISKNNKLNLFSQNIKKTKISPNYSLMFFTNNKQFKEFNYNCKINFNNKII